MKHLPTFCQWIVRKFAKAHKKDVVVTFSKRLTRTLGLCISYKTKSGCRYYEIRLNLEGLRLVSDTLIEDLILHECIHILVKGHGSEFKKYCLMYELDERFHGSRVPKGSSIRWDEQPLSRPADKD